MQSETRNITSLFPWEDNPRSIKKRKYEQLKQRITRFGQFKPLIITPNGEVIGGNMRYRAYLELGIVDIWVSVVNPKTEAEKIEIALADNEEMGYYEDQVLAELISRYQVEINLVDYSIHLGEPVSLKELLERYGPEPEEDEVPQVSNEPADSKLGEIYQLGHHRLMCGDATKLDDVMKLMNGKTADLLHTDPPYNVAYEGKTKDRLTIENDSQSPDEFRQFLRDSFSNAVAVMRQGGAFYIYHADSEGYAFRGGAVDSGLYIRQCLVWVKNAMVMGRQDYQWKHEPILYGWVVGAAHSWYADRKQTTVVEFDKPTKNAEHPTMKPVSLCVYFIKNSSKPNDIVLDLFLGSGSTLIACEQTGRICYGLELDPKYCDVIRRRYWMVTHNGDDTGWEEGTKAL